MSESQAPRDPIQKFRVELPPPIFVGGAVATAAAAALGGWAVSTRLEGMAGMAALAGVGLAVGAFGGAALHLLLRGRPRRMYRQLAEWLIREQEEERRRVADTLRNDTAQRLAGLLIQLRRLSASDGPSPDGQLLRQIRGEAQEALEGVRRLARELLPPELDDLGVAEAVRAHARWLNQAGGPEVQVEEEALPADLPAEVRLVLYRFVQESLVSVACRSGAPGARVRLGSGGDRVFAEVEALGESGVRPEIRERDRQELARAQERVARLGGRLVASEDEHGRCCRLRVELPAEGASPAVWRPPPGLDRAAGGSA